MVKNKDNLSNLESNHEKIVSEDLSKNGLAIRFEATLPKTVRSTKQEEFWNDFKAYLANEGNSEASIRDRLSYAKRFYFILEKEDASSITTLTPDVKSHVMKALAALSKFSGAYEHWLMLIKKYSLKWSKETAL